MKFPILFIVRVSLLASIATVLLFWHFPLLFMPTFLTLDISDVPVLVGTLLLGWPSGVAIAIAKNLLHLGVSSSFGIGEIANCMLSITYITIIYFCRHLGFWSYLLGILGLSAMAVFLNFTVLLPLYQTAFHISTEQLLSLTRAAGNPTVTIWDFMWWVIVPFNIIKGSLVALLSFPIYQRLRILTLFQSPPR